MVLVPLLVAPAVMAAASLIERRLGPSAAGWVAALPVAFAVAVVAVSVDATAHVAASMALSAAAHVSAQVVFGVVFAGVMQRRVFCSVPGPAYSPIWPARCSSRTCRQLSSFSSRSARWWSRRGSCRPAKFGVARLGIGRPPP
jgi:hypothetical protein